jgi:hypothetical protein
VIKGAHFFLPMDRELERRLPARVYDAVDNALSTVWLLMGKKLSLDSHPDPRAGRTDMGTTYEDFHLFWPIRPRTWLAFPEASSQSFKYLSRDHLLLKEEQSAFVRNDNAAFAGQQLGVSPAQVYANQVYSTVQRRLAPVYEADVDLYSPMNARTPYTLGLSDPKLAEFWDDHLVDRDVGDRVRHVRQVATLASLGLAAFTTFKLWTPATRILAIPIGVATGYLGAISAVSIMQPLTGTEGLNRKLWESRVTDGISLYQKQSGSDLEVEKDLIDLSYFHPFANPFITHV